MDVREKLVEMLDEAEEWANHKCDELDCETCPARKMRGNCFQQLMVGRLIDNGVTVQEWISVDDRLPDNDGQYLIFTTQYFTPDHIDEIDHIDGIEISGYSKRFWFLSKNGIYAKYWCEMPQPPKGE